MKIKILFWTVELEVTEDTKNRVISNIEKSNSTVYQTQKIRAEMGRDIIENLKNGNDVCSDIYREMVESIGEIETNKILISSAI